MDKPLLGSGLSVLKILLVEDSDFDSALIAQLLIDGGIVCNIVRVRTGAELLQALCIRYDLVITDISLPGFGETGALDILRRRSQATPVIIVSGTIDDTSGVLAMRQGVADYLLKDRLARLPQAVWTAVERARARSGARLALTDVKNMPLELIRAREHERQLLCQDLHDDFGQRLALLKLCLNRMRKSILDPDAAETWRHADEAVASLVAQIRELSGALRPESLACLGLESAIRQLLQSHFAHTEMAFDFEFAGVPDQLDDAIKLTAFRVVQEGITNIVRHSQATRVVVEISSGGGDEELEVIVRDNGVGMCRRKSDPEQVGLRNGGLCAMRERVELLGGILKTSAIPEQGTCIVASIPLKRLHDEAADHIAG